MEITKSYIKRKEQEMLHVWHTVERKYIKDNPVWDKTDKKVNEMYWRGYWAALNDILEDIEEEDNEQSGIYGNSRRNKEK